MNKIILEPVSSEIYKQDNLEPQYVTFQYQNQGEIFLDSQFCVDKISPTNINISTKKNINDRENILFSNISRIAVQSFGLMYITPNVNPRNNEIRFFSTNSGTYHTIQLLEGFYTTADQLIDHIVDRLNTVFPDSGLTFSKTTVHTSYYNLNSAGGSYFFDLNCNAVTKGYQLYNLPKDQTATNTKRVGFMGLYYTRYIDVCSKQLTKYSKIQSKSTGFNNNLVERLFIDDPTKPHVIAQYESNSSIFNYKRTDNVSTVDIQLFDQFGDSLYISDSNNNTDSGFWFDLNITVF